MHVIELISASLLLFSITAFPNAVSALLLKTEDGSYVRMDWAVKRGLTKGSITRLPLTVNSDGTYSTIVNMGTPFQDVPFTISLSQNYIVVAGRPDTVIPGPTSLPYYNPAASSSFANDTTTPPVQIASRDGGSDFVQAHFARESCKTGDFPYNASVAITPVNATSEIFPGGTAGILGYGVSPAKSAPADATLLGVYLPANFTAAECGFQLGRAGDTTGGIFTMGGRDSTAIAGDFTQLVVPPSGDSTAHPDWSVTLDSVTAETSNTTQQIVGALASIDPFYPDITIPVGDAANFYSKVPGAHATDNTGTRYFVPCDATIKLSLSFGGRLFVMDPRDGVVHEGPICYGGLRGGGGKVLKVGANFLRNVYTIFGATIANGNATFTVGFANLSPAALQGNGGGSSSLGGGNPTGAPPGSPVPTTSLGSGQPAEPEPSQSFSNGAPSRSKISSAYIQSILFGGAIIIVLGGLVAV